MNYDFKIEFFFLTKQLSCKTPKTIFDFQSSRSLKISLRDDLSHKIIPNTPAFVHTFVDYFLVWSLRSTPALFSLEAPAKRLILLSDERRRFASQCLITFFRNKFPTHTSFNRSLGFILVKASRLNLSFEKTCWSVNPSQISLYQVFSIYFTFEHSFHRSWSWEDMAYIVS